MALTDSIHKKKTLWRTCLLTFGGSCVLVVIALLMTFVFPHQPYIHALPALTAFFVLGAAGCCIVRCLRLLDASYGVISQLSAHDDITGLPNRQWFFDRLDEELDRAFRYNHPVSLIMVDIDHLRRVNDTFGHALGDTVLAEVARLVSANVRTTDRVVRYGGEEFVVLLPETTMEQALVVAEKVRMVVEVNDLNLYGPPVKVTLSCGVADVRFVQKKKGPLRDAFVLAANTAMRLAKKHGRNQVQAFVPKTDKHIRLV
ncbi:diguanylate cyclase [Pseudodesulfovibrio sp. JC047]|uniref:GGDEF domain-containing protein n=1 Tax=Pseudodesulfovibrio sp. JC047 TaxID=2683199 RepID=UPI0013D08B7F|nr:GGDEF domain-containing protein [Pseudodesulfovibrio sp. JC047]NDV20994.1 diguanylate cyclase [Pseudodesulfovibrio sp. JC047]